jgi:hypothetical protein
MVGINGGKKDGAWRRFSQYIDARARREKRTPSEMAAIVRTHYNRYLVLDRLGQL